MPYCDGKTVESRLKMEKKSRSFVYKNGSVEGRKKAEQEGEQILSKRRFNHVRKGRMHNQEKKQSSSRTERV
ncbi:MAG TPA: hypothetical protein VGK23_01050 [Methanomassiliicoccales archaeon]|jgi:hypothetical protein